MTDTYTAFYPYTDDGTLTLDNTAITFTLPATQTATAGGFANGLNPSWAQATDGSKNLTFQNLCALAKFTVDAEGVTEVTLTANNTGDALSGGLTYTIADGTLTATGSASRSVTLTGTFTRGKEYYFVVAPGTLTGGITLNYMGEGGKTYVKTTQAHWISPISPRPSMRRLPMPWKNSTHISAGGRTPMAPYPWMRITEWK